MADNQSPAPEPQFYPYSPMKTFLGYFRSSVDKALEPLDKKPPPPPDNKAPGYAKGVSKVGGTRLGMVSGSRQSKPR